MFTPQSATVLVIRCIRDAENSIPTQFLNKVFSLHCCQKFPRTHPNPSKFDMERVFIVTCLLFAQFMQVYKNSHETRAKDFKASLGCKSW